jgi:tRNA (guanine-N7-)-methyltransferase
VKPSPTALQRYLLEPQAGILPLRPAEISGRSAQVVVEVGFGGGEYLAWWAQQHPQIDFFGIEQPADCIFRAARRFEDAGLENVHLIRGDARYLLRELFPAGSLQHVLMQFPMPWPKDKHAKHRVSSPGFAATLADVLAPGGIFELVTDQDWYAHDADRFFAANPSFTSDPLEVDPDRPFRTRYETKWLEEGRSIHRLLVRLKTPAPAPRLLLDPTMDTFALQPPLSDTKIQALKGSRFKEGETVAEVKEILTAEDGWVLRTVASDGSFSQMFHIRIRNKADGRCLLKVDEVPRPYYTAAVRFALQATCAALTSPSTSAVDGT